MDAMLSIGPTLDFTAEIHVMEVESYCMLWHSIRLNTQHANRHTISQVSPLKPFGWLLSMLGRNTRASAESGNGDLLGPKWLPVKVVDQLQV